MDPALQSLVRLRANEVCEYCRLPQAVSRFARFHIEHIIARQHGGPTVEGNLALACSFCNYHKGPNIASLDPLTGMLAPLFNPRRDSWTEHFAWDEIILKGTSPVGRSTVQLLAINDDQRLRMRDGLRTLGVPFAG